MEAGRRLPTARAAAPAAPAAVPGGIAAAAAELYTHCVEGKADDVRGVCAHVRGCHGGRGVAALLRSRDPASGETPLSAACRAKRGGCGNDGWVGIVAFVLTEGYYGEVAAAAGDGAGAVRAAGAAADGDGDAGARAGGRRATARFANGQVSPINATDRYFEATALHYTMWSSGGGPRAAVVAAQRRALGRTAGGAGGAAMPHTDQANGPDESCNDEEAAITRVAVALLGAGADPTAVDFEGRSVVEWCEKYGTPPALSAPRRRLLGTISACASIGTAHAVLRHLEAHPGDRLLEVVTDVTTPLEAALQRAAAAETRTAEALEAAESSQLECEELRRQLASAKRDFARAKRKAASAMLKVAAADARAAAAERIAADARRVQGQRVTGRKRSKCAIQ